jgi:hypothetical protein
VLKISLANHLPINSGNVGSPLKTSIETVEKDGLSFLPVW